LVEIKLTIIFFELAQTTTIWMLNSIDNVVWLSKVDLVFISNDLSLRLGLQTHLNDISRLIVKQTMGISQPRNRTEKDTKK
jgi:hypothetical protein